MVEGNDNHIKILLLEDEPIISKVTSRVLTADGYQVEIAKDGLIAREKIISNQYDLMIFDVRTPSMSGIQLYEYMERTYPHLTRRVMFSTGDSLSGGTKMFLERVRSPYINKPYTPSELREKVHEALNKIEIN
jgi:DNA-binding response OmpR family regulator